MTLIQPRPIQPLEKFGLMAKARSDQIRAAFNFTVLKTTKMMEAHPQNPFADLGKRECAVGQLQCFSALFAPWRETHRRMPLGLNNRQAAARM